MVKRAQRLDTKFGRTGVVFVRHAREDLVPNSRPAQLTSSRACSVLQHLPLRVAIEVYLREFVRVLSPGGVAVVQLPVHVPPDPSADLYVPLRTRGKRLLRSLGVSPTFLYERLGWQRTR